MMLYQLLWQHNGNYLVCQNARKLIYLMSWLVCLPMWNFHFPFRRLNTIYGLVRAIPTLRAYCSNHPVSNLSNVWMFKLVTVLLPSPFKPIYMLYYIILPICVQVDGYVMLQWSSCQPIYCVKSANIEHVKAKPFILFMTTSLSNPLFVQINCSRFLSIVPICSTVESHGLQYPWIRSDLS
jgi:hypothetical protein